MIPAGIRKAAAMSPHFPWRPPRTDESMWLPSALLVNTRSYLAHAFASVRGTRTFETRRLDSGSTAAATRYVLPSATNRRSSVLP
jgi:hypothetical protein